jgi:hypothetical protein
MFLLKSTSMAVDKGPYDGTTVRRRGRDLGTEHRRQTRQYKEHRRIRQKIASEPSMWIDMAGCGFMALLTTKVK